MDKLPRDEKYYCKGLAIGGFLKTKDDKFVFGVRSGKTITSNKVEFIDGIVENKIELKKEEDFKKNLYTEITSLDFVKYENLESYIEKTGDYRPNVFKDFKDAL